MSIEKMREEFEAWECDSDHGPQTDPVWLMYDAKTNTYPLDKIQARWMTWQESRAALVYDGDLSYALILTERQQLKTENIDLHATLQAAKGEIERLRSAIKTVECRFEISEDTLKTIRGCLASAESDIDQLKAENEALRNDAARWQFVRDVWPKVKLVPNGDWFSSCFLEREIDAAMSKEASHDA